MRFNIMGLIAVFAAVALVTACESATEGTSVASGAGAAKKEMTKMPQKPAATTKAKMAGPKAGSQADLVINVGDRVFFDLDKFSLKSDARATLEKQAAWLKQHSGLTITVEGHCDERGTREYNLALGERRANATKDYLIALGISPGRIKTISYGKERPVALGSNDEAWSQNRRASTSVTGGSPSG
jgi:peptidoglycan-associated lipoprotein